MRFFGLFFIHAFLLVHHISYIYPCTHWNVWILSIFHLHHLFLFYVFSAKKSIFTKFNASDDTDPVVLCNHLQIGFTMPCAKAWAWDEVNTKNLVSIRFRSCPPFNSLPFSYHELSPPRSPPRLFAVCRLYLRFYRRDFRIHLQIWMFHIKTLQWQPLTKLYLDLNLSLKSVQPDVVWIS